jgi:hypothetical protein
MRVNLALKSPRSVTANSTTPPRIAAAYSSPSENVRTALDGIVFPVFTLKGYRFASLLIKSTELASRKFHTRPRGRRGLRRAITGPDLRLKVADGSSP